MIAQSLDFNAQFHQPALENAGRISSRFVEKGTNVVQLETGATVKTDLPQTLQVVLAINPVISLAAANVSEEPDGLVVQNGTTTQPASAGQFGDGQGHSF